MIADGEPRDGGVMTVRTALALPPVRRGRPEVVAGRGALERSIRWVGERRRGVDRPRPQGRRAAAHDRARHRPAGRRAAPLRRRAMRARGGGRRHRARCGHGGPPQALVARAEQRGLPVIAFRRGVPFVEITEAIHGAIVNRQYALLRRGEAIHRRFTELVLEGQGIPEVMDALAAMIADPVVLESARGGAPLPRRARRGAGGGPGRVGGTSARAGARAGERGRSTPCRCRSRWPTAQRTAASPRSPSIVAARRATTGSRSSAPWAWIALALLRAPAGGGAERAAAASSWPSSRRACSRPRRRAAARRRSGSPTGAAPCCRWPSALTRRPSLTRAAVWAPVARRLRDEIDALGVPALLGDRRREGEQYVAVLCRSLR